MKLSTIDTGISRLVIRGKIEVIMLSEL